MDIGIIALEKLIKENEDKISNCTKQLKDLESGTITLSPMKIASIENTLEQSQNDYKIYKNIYDAIPQKKKDNVKKIIRVQEALAKQSYYKLQKIRLKRNKNIKRDQRLEAMMILDELPSDVNFDDKELLEISEVIIKNNIREVIELEKDLQIIKQEFNKEIEKLKDNEDLKHFKFLDDYIPIIILHFSSFVQSIKNSVEEYNENIITNNSNEKIMKFSGLPKYEDWWIEELFKNHQAYFGLYKWKDIIYNQCLNEQQQIIWEKIFTNWLMIKKILCNKDENAYDYNLIFDKLIFKYATLEEELDLNNLKSMENIVYNIIKKENFTLNKSKHLINTTYAQWKKSKLNSAD